MVAALAGVLFVRQERHARDPMVAFRLWGRRAIATTNTATLLSGMAVVGLTTFLPMYVQVVLGYSALIAGLTLTVIMLGWPFGAILAARNFARYGLRSTLIFGGVLLPVGATAFVLLAPGVSPWVAGLGSLVMGAGMGFLTTAAIIIIQDSVSWAERGSATASNLFSRNLGSTLGAALLGAAFNISLAHYGAIPAKQIRELLESGAQAANEASARMALGHALHVTFWGVMLIALATMLAALFVPTIRLHQQTRGGESPL
jgi:MFS family permease